MTKQETAQVIAVLQVAFPNFYRDVSREELTQSIELWAQMFAEDSYPEVCAAIKALICTKTNTFPPAIGEVKAKLYELRNAGEMDESEAWALVSKACANGIYGYRKEFDKLPPEVQAAVGAPEVLREWAMMDAETVQSVVSSNFRRTFRAKSAKRKEFAMLPDSVRKMISLPEKKTGEKPDQIRVVGLTPLFALPEAEKEPEREPPEQPEYKPLSEQEFERLREEKIQALLSAAKKGEP